MPQYRPTAKIRITPGLGIVDDFTQLGVDRQVACGVVDVKSFYLESSEDVAGRLTQCAGILPEITGAAYLTGTSQFFFDPDDPLWAGFLL